MNREFAQAAVGSGLARAAIAVHEDRTERGRLASPRCLQAPAVGATAAAGMIRVCLAAKASTSGSIVTDLNRGEVVVDLWMASATPALARFWSNAVPPARRRPLSQLRDVERDRRVVQLALRQSVTANRLGLPLGDVELGTGDTGAIAAPAPGLALSASHHDDVTVLGVADNVRGIGVDVEPTDEDDWDTALDDVLTTEEHAALRSLPAEAQQAAYFACWTRKEAVMKALGEGLSDRDPKSIEVTVPPAAARLVSLDGAAVAGWALSTIAVDGYVCSVAVIGVDGMRLKLRRWPVDLPAPAR